MYIKGQNPNSLDASCFEKFQVCFAGITARIMDQSYLTELDNEYRETSSKVSRLISRLKTAPDSEIRGLIDEIKNELQNCSTSVHIHHSLSL